VKFWDTSAIIPECVLEPSSSTIRALLEVDLEIGVWWGTRVECVSALTRRHRGVPFSQLARVEASRRLQALSDVWVEIEPSVTIRANAERLITLHPLSAADAFQLAAALAWCGNHSAGAGFVCLDIRLREAALLEGFAVEPVSI
jgi:predicted nucleic acid-binding protein